MVCHLPAKLGGNKRRSGRKIILICLWTTSDHVFKGLCDFMRGSTSRSVTTLPCLVAIGPVQMQSIWFGTWHHKTTWLKNHVTLSVGAPHCESPSSQVCLSWALWLWRYVLNLTRDFIKPYDERVIRIHSVQAKPGISGIFRKTHGKPGNHREIWNRN